MISILSQTEGCWRNSGIGDRGIALYHAPSDWGQRTLLPLRTEMRR